MTNSYELYQNSINSGPYAEEAAVGCCVKIACEIFDELMKTKQSALLTQFAQAWGASYDSMKRPIKDLNLKHINIKTEENFELWEGFLLFSTVVILEAVKLKLTENMDEVNASYEAAKTRFSKSSDCLLNMNEEKKPKHKELPTFSNKEYSAKLFVKLVTEIDDLLNRRLDKEYKMEQAFGKIPSISTRRRAIRELKIMHSNLKQASDCDMAVLQLASLQNKIRTSDLGGLYAVGKRLGEVKLLNPSAESVDTVRSLAERFDEILKQMSAAKTRENKTKQTGDYEVYSQEYENVYNLFDAALQKIRVRISELGNFGAMRALYDMQWELSDQELTNVLIIYRELCKQPLSGLGNLIEDFGYEFANLGIREIRPGADDKFDPEMHLRSGAKAGVSISKTKHSGYMRHERLLLEAVVEIK